MAAPVIQFKRGPSANLPGLAAGEPGFTTDKYELWVGFDGTENNNKFFGSSRYWSPESNTQGGGLRFYEGYDNGDQEVRLVAPNSIPTTQKYTLPLNPQNDFILVTNSDGEWRWTNTLVDVTLTGEVEISGNIISDGDISIGGTSAVFNTETFDTEARIFMLAFQQIQNRQIPHGI